MINIKKLGLMAGALLISGSLVAGAAFAADDSATPAASDTATAAPAKSIALTAEQQAVMTQLRDLRKSYEEKFRAEAKSILDQAVADGKVTQEQADRLVKRHSFGHGPGGKHGFGKRGHHFDFKSLTVEELTAKLGAAVESGRLTQEQADKILEKFQERASESN